MVLQCFLVLLASVVAVGIASAKDILIPAKTFEIKSAIEKNTEGVQFDEGEGRVAFYTNGTATAGIDIEEEAVYTITIEAACDAAKNINAKFKLTVGETVVAKEHTLTTADKKAYTFTTKLKKGKQKLVVEFLNDEYKENEFDRNMYLYDAKLAKK